MKSKKKKKIRIFTTGAFRDNDEQKLNYVGSLSPLALEGFVDFMRRHNIVDGKVRRDEGNWKKGFPKQSYMESKFRHFMETWKIHEGYSTDEILETLYAEFFNIQGYIHELLIERLKDSKKSKKPKYHLACKVCNKSIACKKCEFYILREKKNVKKKNVKKQKVVHYKPASRSSTICGIPVHNAMGSKIKITDIIADVKCKTCKKIIKCWKNPGIKRN